MDKLMLINALLMGLIIAVASGPLFIPFFKKLKFGQYIREEGPKAHYAKAGTPTFGGSLFIFAVVFVLIIFNKFDVTTISLLVAMLGYGVIGFVDDYKKVIMKHNQGLSAKAKMVGLFIVTALLYVMFFSEHLSVFYFNAFQIQGMLWALVFLFIAVAITNAVNLTDGIDGLCGSVSLVVACFFVAVSLKHGAPNLATANSAMVGALVGYLVYNWHPAKVFMGDMGSLALGGYVLVNAVLLGIEWWIPLFGLVYLLETVSVIIQVLYFKSTGGKRFFKMTPIHHHFELSGWSEIKIVSVASAMTALVCVLTYFII